MSSPRKSKGDTLQKLEEDLKAIEHQRARLFELQEPIIKELRESYDKMGVLKNEIGKLRLASSKVVDWELLLTEDSGEAIYKRYDKELWKRGLFGGGVLTHTRQRCIKIKLVKNDELSYNKTLEAVREILPFIKPIPTRRDRGYKFVDVFESTLSEFGTYYLLISETKHIYRLMLSVHMHITELKRFKSLEELVKYVQENHPYETK